MVISHLTSYLRCNYVDTNKTFWYQHYKTHSTPNKYFSWFEKMIACKAVNEKSLASFNNSLQSTASYLKLCFLLFYHKNKFSIDRSFSILLWLCFGRKFRQKSLRTITFLSSKHVALWRGQHENIAIVDVDVYWDI